jgi:WD40 repeat protein
MFNSHASRPAFYAPERRSAMLLSHRCLLMVVGLSIASLVAQAPADDSDNDVPKTPPPPTLQLKARHVFKMEDGPRGTSLSPDGKLLATADGCYIRVWDTRTGKQLGRHRMNDQYMHCALLSPDGRTVACTNGDGEEIHFLDVATGRRLQALGGHRGGTGALALSPDGKLLVSSLESVKLWDVTAGKQLYHLLDKERVSDLTSQTVSSLAWSPDGKTLAIGVYLGDVHLFDVARGKESRRLRAPGQTQHSSRHILAFSPDGRLLAEELGGNAIMLWDPRSGKPVRQLTWPTRYDPKEPEFSEDPPKTPGVSSFVFAPDGRSLIVAGCDRRLHVWEVASVGERYLVAAPGGWLGLGAARAGRVLVGCSREKKEIYLWDLPAWPSAPRPDPLPGAKETWSGLADADAARAYALMRGLVADPREAVALLDKRLTAVPPVGVRKVERLVRDLDDDSFEVREDASRRLGELKEVARDALVSALAKGPGAEPRRRMQQLLDALDAPLDGERLRLLRAVEVLEAISTPEARRMLKRLAAGEPRAPLTREAKAALGRLDLD